MLDMVFDSVKLFLTGRLFQDYTKVIQLFLIGMICGAVVIVAVGYFVSPLAGAIAGGIVSGALQPVLFKNLKYR